MKTRRILSVWLLVLLGGLAWGQQQPGKKLKLNFSERFRLVSFDNSIYLDELNSIAYNFTRHRTSLSLGWEPNRALQLVIRVTNEFRYYLSPKDREFDINELFVDNLYLKWKRPGNLPLDLTVGRQNIMLGEGFVVMDGHPLDGSRSIYFNALRTDVHLAADHTLTGFVTYVPTRDNLLPVLNSVDQFLLEQPQTGAGIYYSGRVKSGRVEGYFIHKYTGETEDIPLTSSIETVGIRSLFKLTQAVSFTAEGAYQLGSEDEYSRSALGGYFHLDWLPASPHWLKLVQLGGIYLSGDDPDTDRQEAWDPLFSRWPKWSESFIYTLILENNGRVAYWSNLTALYLALDLNLAERVQFQFRYYHLGADRYTPGNPFVAGTGKNRGDLYILKLNFQITPHLSGHLLWEDFIPGNYYFPGADTANWIRFELMFKI